LPVRLYHSLVVKVLITVSVAREKSTTNHPARQL